MSEVGQLLEWQSCFFFRLVVLVTPVLVSQFFTVVVIKRHLIKSALSTGVVKIYALLSHIILTETVL